MQKLLSVWKALSKAKKALVIIVGLFIIMASHGNTQKNASLVNTNADQTSSSSASVQPIEEKAPLITTRSLAETKSVPHDSTTVNSSSLAKGTSKVTTVGVDGVETLIYDVTYSDDIETSRKLVSDQVSTQPVSEVTTIGTYVAPTSVAAPSGNCDPNYSGACVPIASDVDCAGGTGNGPAYVRGPVRVIGYDIYDLDRDGNGLGCE